MSSHDVAKSVSKKLKYYFDIKRREDGFDLTGPDCPRLDHPPLRSRPTLMYDGLHDKPVKHYFREPKARHALTQFKGDGDKAAREKHIRKVIEKYMKKYSYVDPPVKKSTDTDGSNDSQNPNNSNEKQVTFEKNAKEKRNPKKGTPYKKKGKGLQSNPPKTKGKKSKPKKKRPESPGLMELFYKSEARAGRSSRPDSHSFNTPLKKRKKPHIGPNPVLRSVPNKVISKGEAERLISMATKLLVATETVGLLQPREKKEKKNKKTDTQSAPRPFESNRDEHLPAVRGADEEQNGRRQRPRKEDRIGRSEEDSAYETPGSSSPQHYDNEEGNVPRWLKSEMRKQNVEERKANDNLWVRPLPHPPSPRSERSYSSASSSRSTTSSHSSRSRTSASSRENLTSREEAGTQTSRELLRDFKPMETIVTDGEKVNYEVHVFTGSKLGASTKADVKLILYGDKGRTKDIWLEKSTTFKVKFQKGQEDVFKINNFCVGKIRMLAIGHTRNELGFGWFLEKVEVRDTNKKLLYMFPCGRWLSSREGDGKTIREFRTETVTAYQEVETSSVDDNQSKDDNNLPLGNETFPREESDLTPHPVQSGSQSSMDNNVDSQAKRKGSDTNRSQSSRSSYSTSASSSSDDESVKDVTKPRQVIRIPSPPPQPQARKCDFFDQAPAGKDYSSVIDNISATTGNTDRKEDFESDQAVFTKDDLGRHSSSSSASSTISDDSEKATLRLETAEENKKRTEEEFLDGFKAGLEAAKSQHDAEQEKKEEEEKELRRGPTIHEAACKGDIDRVKALIEHNPDLKIARDERGYTVLHCAADSGQHEIIKWLTLNLTDLNIETQTGYTAFHLCSMHGYVDCLLVLYAMGASLDSKTMEQQTPLHVAAMSGQLETVKWLVSNSADVNARDVMSRTPFDIAEQYEKKEIADFLRAQRPDNRVVVGGRDSDDDHGSDGSDKEKVLEAYKEQLQRTGESKASSQNSGEKQKPADTRSAPSKMYEDDSDTSDSDSSSSSSDSSSSSSSSDTEDERPTTNKNYSLDDEDDALNSFMKNKKQHDAELMRKKQMYNQQQRKMSSQNTTFLDSIRDENKEVESTKF